MWNGELVLRYIQKMESLEVRTEAQMVTNGLISNPLWLLLRTTDRNCSQVLGNGSDVSRKWSLVAATARKRSHVIATDRKATARARKWLHLVKIDCYWTLVRLKSAATGLQWNQPNSRFPEVEPSEVHHRNEVCIHLFQETLETIWTEIISYSIIDINSPKIFSMSPDGKEGFKFEEFYNLRLVHEQSSTESRYNIRHSPIPCWTTSHSFVYLSVHDGMGTEEEPYFLPFAKYGAQKTVRQIFRTDTKRIQSLKGIYQGRWSWSGDAVHVYLEWLY